MPFQRSSRNDKTKKKKKKKILRKKICKFCADRNGAVLDYKDTARLAKFMTEKGKIIPRKVSGNCTRHQRHMVRAIKRARQIALLPYSG